MILILNIRDALTTLRRSNLINARLDDKVIVNYIYTIVEGIFDNADLTDNNLVIDAALTSAYDSLDSYALANAVLKAIEGSQALYTAILGAIPKMCDYRTIALLEHQSGGSKLYLRLS